MLYVYTCPVCGIVVRIDHASEYLPDIKACLCDADPIASTEVEDDDAGV